MNNNDLNMIRKYITIKHANTSAHRCIISEQNDEDVK
jgi:hypothetical protein